MRILLYQPYNQIVVYIESVIEQFVKEGHVVYFLSHDVRGDTHINLEKMGCQTFVLNVSRKWFGQYYRQRIFGLARFCRKNQIDVVYSHFQEANIIAVFAQFFCKSAFVITRHHTDCGFVDDNWKERMTDKIINRLSKYYVAISDSVKSHMLSEHTDPGKIWMINLGYNFDNFRNVDVEEAKRIRKENQAKLLLIKAARLIPEKRHLRLLPVVKKLIEEGFDIRLLLLGRGPMEEEITTWIKDNEMSERIRFIGFKVNVMDYYAAADLIVHFSISEASNSAMKEAGLVYTPVAVCTGVGDFDDYIVDGSNGFHMSRDNPEDDFVKLVKEIDKNVYDLKAMGRKLHEEVVERFDIQSMMPKYEALHNAIANQKSAR
jgi:glycosyltransferase involved in cell wall biosynthesis